MVKEIGECISGSIIVKEELITIEIEKKYKIWIKFMYYKLGPQ